MLTGAHAILYSSNADADRAFFRDVLELENVDVGGGWLIFALPPAELAVHPAKQNDRHDRGHAPPRRQAGHLPAPSRAPDLTNTTLFRNGWIHR